MNAEHAPLAHRAVLVLPRIRVQNANAISSPMTWGFPAITAFAGLRTALERKLGRSSGIALLGVGVVCHDFEAQVTQDGYTRAFHLTRNPLLSDGSTAAIVEEGRVHMTITLVFDALLDDNHREDAARAELAKALHQEVMEMRIAGGSVLPWDTTGATKRLQPYLELQPDLLPTDNYRRWWRRLSRRWLPGFALVLREDLLQERLAALRSHNAEATVFDAWLDLSRWNSHAAAPAAESTDPAERVEWTTEPRAGWIVPVPVGFASITPLQAAGTVSGARDMTTPVRFVEPILSIGQWISPHRLINLRALLWDVETDHDSEAPERLAVYRCINHFTANSSSQPHEAANTL